MSESLTKLHCEIDDSTTLQIAHLVNRHLKKTFPASQPFISQKFRENLKTLRVAVQSKLAGFSLTCFFCMFLLSNSILFCVFFLVRIAVLPLSVDYLYLYAAENKKKFVGLFGLMA